MTTEIEVVEVKNELIEIADNQLDAAYKTEGGTKALYDFVAERARSVVPDMTTVKGRKAIVSLANKVATSKVAFDNYGKKLGADAKAIIDGYNTDRKFFWDECEKLQKEIRKPVTDWENKEKLRIEIHQKSVAAFAWTISALPLQSTTAEVYAAKISEMELLVIDDNWDEFKDAGIKARDEALVTLRGLHHERKLFETAQAELERVKAEKAAQEKAANDKRIADEATAKANAAAQKKIDDLQAQNDALIEQVVAKPKADPAPTPATGADVMKMPAPSYGIKVKSPTEVAMQVSVVSDPERERVAAINRAILDSFTALGANEATAKNIIRAIAKGSIDNIKITY